MRTGALVQTPKHPTFGPLAVVMNSTPNSVVVCDGRAVLTYEPKDLQELGWVRYEKTSAPAWGVRIARLIRVLARESIGPDDRSEREER